MTQGGLAILALAIYERGGDKAVDPRGGEVTRPRIREAKVCVGRDPSFSRRTAKRESEMGTLGFGGKGSARRKGIDGKAVRGGKRRCEIQL